MTELGAFLLPAAPLLFLLVALLLGRYPGHAAIVRLSERIAARSHRPASRPLRPRAPRAPRSFAPGGGLLIALSLAQRPPPLPV
ncbi:MAG: hypothetical protein ACOYD4_08520 [Solirubrobacterales bacterium]